MVFLGNNFNEMVQYVLRGQEQKDLFQLTERTVFWATLIDDTVSDSFLLGYGYQMLSLAGMLKYFPEQGYTISNAHNTFIQTFVGLGAIGLSLLLYSIFKAFVAFFFVYHNISRREKYAIVELLIIIIVCLLASLTQFGIAGLTTPVVPAYFMAIMLLTISRIRVIHNLKIKQLLTG